MQQTSLPASEFIAPITHSHKANELEEAMAGVFALMVDDYCLDALNDIFSYSVPWQGSQSVVERFTKLNGLVVLRRDDEGLSDTLMRIIYANWQALASERGLGFLQFVLNMLYPQQNKIVRLWHSKTLAHRYPLHLTDTERSDRFLTSRIRIELDAAVNVQELSELAPTLSRLVPWQVVPQIAVSLPPTEDMGVKVAAAGNVFAVADFSPS
ncbi:MULTISPECIES: hypothetical protein [unclassified Psychrobacter]|uniref:hypothetical protein n=1 Tax=unclassified Psychrobacter TaxID=196806 RepID=UPI0018F32040|nr:MULTISPECIES: hypothetical protein [unclassified Psychrobacter]